jgi:hypothetical protein
MKVSLSKDSKTLTIELPVEPVASKSGKSLVIASTRGNQPTTVEFNGKPITIGVNAYTANPPAATAPVGK